MKASFFASAIALASIVVGVACASPVAEGDDSTSSEQAVSDKACHTKCLKCAPNKICALACTLSGNCGTTCTQTMLCIQGYVWDDRACQCVPSPGSGEACGNGTCGAGQFCCNASCGICAPAGGACTQEVCASPL
jgi:hypothetical protein